MSNHLKIFGYKITIAGAAAFIITGILIGVLNEFGKDIYGWLKNSDYRFLSVVINLIIDFLFFKIEINVLTILVSLSLAIPIYRFLTRRIFGKLISETIFVEDFKSSKNYWNLNFWGSTNPSKTNRIENNEMIFEANPDEWQNNSEGGAYLDLRNGIQQGLTYHISCKAKSTSGTTMAFRLWLHDAMGKQSATTNWETPPSNQYKTYDLKYHTTDSQAIRIHLHCKSGQGQINIKEVKVVRN